MEWLRPYTDDTIKQLCKEGVDALVVVPISFVSEHIETLEEIDMEYRELAEECGVRYWERVPCLQLEQDFIDDLAGAVVEALPKMDERPLQEINEGRPVSLRVVNDLIELKTKESAIEYGPVKYQQQRRMGLTPRSMPKVSAWKCPGCASPGRASRFFGLLNPQGERKQAGPLGAQPLPLVLVKAAPPKCPPPPPLILQAAR